MKFIKTCILILFFLMYNGCGGNTGDSLSAGVDSQWPDLNTPVIFVHGLSATGGDSFYNMYEKFCLYGFPESRMAIPLLPRINAGAFNGNYAWYTPVSPLSYSAAHWTANYINADSLKEVIDLLAPGPRSKVNLVGHSNGTAVILKLLAKYPVYSGKIKKIVFISGFADLSGADGLDNIVSDLNSCMPFSDLPPDIEYYAISSESDANINLSETIYGRPSKNNLEPFGNTIRYWPMDESDRIVETNFNVTGMDHQAILTSEKTIRQVFTWLTGVSPRVEVEPALITAGGRIVAASGYSQQGVASGSVKLEYYDPLTGSVTGLAGECAISSGGRYSISGVSTSRYLKMTVRANADVNVYFFAERIKYNNSALDFNAPERIASDNLNGMVSVQVICRYSYLSSTVYKKRRSDSFSGRVRAEGCSEVILDSSCIPMSVPSSYLSINLANFGSTDTTTGTGNSFNFDPDALNSYASKNVYFTADLQNMGVKTTVMINGADRSNNIRNHIVYLYPPVMP